MSLEFDNVIGTTFLISKWGEKKLNREFVHFLVSLLFFGPIVATFASDWPVGAHCLFTSGNVRFVRLAQPAGPVGKMILRFV